MSAFSLPVRRTTRFAPSITGFLHLGHVANAVWTWGAAQASGGRVLLRMEDHDRGRWRPDYEPAIRRDLEWLGLEPDQESVRSLDSTPSGFRQSDNGARYREALARLARVTSVYHCECSRKSIARAIGVEPEAGAELRYPGICRDKGLGEGPGRSVRIALPEDEVVFEDLRLGTLRQRPAEQCGDMVVRDQTGSWTYQLCVVVDDIEHGVDLIVRGEDILPSTGRQILLGELLGWHRPAYLHHPLILDETGAKLSKREASAAIAGLRAEGRTPEEVLGMAAAATGLLPSARPIAADELGGLFADGVPRVA